MTRETSQRVIKFRVWDERYSPPMMRNVQNWRDFELKDQCPLMQFTGLHDKHGKEIYEGDIISQEDDVKHNPPSVSTIVWKGSGFWCDEVGTGINGDLEGNMNYDTIVIGNIHANPTLLKESHAKSQ